jgi:hemolysin activation/secretion protein
VTIGGTGGLPYFGALRDALGLPDYAARAEYMKWTGTLSYYRAFRFEGINLSINSTLTGQQSNRVLYGTEQITVGGIYAVRGFDRTTLAGDSGYVWRNDLSFPLSFAGPWKGRFGALSLRPYVGADLGEAFSSISGIPGYEGPGGTLAGITLGTAIVLGQFNGELFYSKSVEHPAAMIYEAGHLYFRVNYTF